MVVINVDISAEIGLSHFIDHDFVGHDEYPGMENEDVGHVGRAFEDLLLANMHHFEGLENYAFHHPPPKVLDEVVLQALYVVNRLRILMKARINPVVHAEHHHL